MKKLLISLLFFSLVPASLAASEIEGIEASAAIKIGGSHFVAGQTVNFQNDIDTDLFTAGQVLNINAEVEEDLFAAGQVININSIINDDARLTGQNININADVEESVMAAGRNITINENVEIGEDFVAAGQKITIRGDVANDINLVGETVIISGEIGGDAEIRAENISFENGAIILGNLKIGTNQEKDFSNFVDGEVERVEYAGWGASFDSSEIVRAIGKIAIWFLIIKYVYCVFIAIILILLFKNFIADFTQEARKNALLDSVLGLAFIFILPFLFILLVAISFGFLAPLIGFFSLVWILLLIVASMFDGFFLGSLIIKIDKKSSFWRMLGAFALGELILTILIFIPILGHLAILIIFSIGLGQLLKSEYDFMKYLKKAKKI